MVRVALLMLLLFSCNYSKIKQPNLKIERKNILNYPNDPGYIFFSLKNNTNKPIYFDSFDINVTFKSLIRDTLEEIPIALDYFFTANDKNRGIKADSVIKKEWKKLFKEPGDYKDSWVSGRLIFYNDSLRESTIKELGEDLNSYVFLESDSTYMDYIDLYPFYFEGYNNIEVSIEYNPHGTDLSGWDYTFKIPNILFDYYYLSMPISKQIIKIEL